jgi:hypothetical protein
VCFLRFAQEGVDEELSYPEFIELFVALAEAAAAHIGGDISQLEKVHLLLFHMSSALGYPKNELKMLNNVRNIVRESLK